MMAARATSARLLDRLPPVRGRIAEAVPLAPLTWFRVGGPAEVMFRPADADDLAAFIAAKPKDVPVTVIGVASNLLVRDGGIPGTIGGGLRMNAGAYGGEFKDVLIDAEAVSPEGKRTILPKAQLGLSYRHCGLDPDWIFTAARFKGVAGDRDEIGRRMAEIQAQREASQPIRARTGGSTFANPKGRKAWELIDQAGCRGLVRGGAQVSEKHANFLINTGTATAADIEGLGEEVRRRVHAQFGVTLDWEIRRVGKPLNGNGPKTAGGSP